MSDDEAEERAAGPESPRRRLRWIRRGRAARMGWGVLAGFFGPLGAYWILRDVGVLQAGSAFKLLFQWTLSFSFIVGLPWAWRTARKTNEEQVRTRVEEGRLHIVPPRYMVESSPVRSIEAAEVRSALWWPSEGEGSAGELELELEVGDRVRLVLPSEEEAFAVMKGLGVAPEMRRIAVSSGSDVAPSLWMASAAIASFVASTWFLTEEMFPGELKSVRLVWLGLAMLVGWVASQLAVPGRVVVGSEAMIIERPWGRRLLLYRDIERVDRDGAVLEIVLRDGSRVRCGSRRFASDRQRGLAARLKAAVRAAQGEGRGEVALGFLDRADRTVADWWDALRRLADDRGYRAASLSPGELLDVAVDPSVARERRLGALLAISDTLTPRERKKLRIAARRTASPKLRIALEQASDDALEAHAVDEALAEEEPARGDRVG